MQPELDLPVAGDARATEPATTNILGANPLIPFDASQLAEASAILLRLLGAHPRTVMTHQAAMVRELARLGLRKLRPGKSSASGTVVHVSQDGLWKQGHVIVSRRLNALLDDMDAPARDVRRARFALAHALEATSPDHHLRGLEGLIRELLRTRGRSLVSGLGHLLDDVLHNGGLPRLVDERPFKPGQNLAATPGRIVWRNPVCEIIQYGAQTEQVMGKPLLIVPPQINKYYLFDLSPENSFVRWAVSQRVPVFAISWRNPTARQRDWGLEIYTHTLGDAVDVVCNISGAASVNLLAASMGGLTAALFAGHRAATDGQSSINSLTLLTSALDTTDPSLLGLFATDAAIEEAIARSRESGVMDGAESARAWSWLQPRDMIWSQIVNNYLMGQTPPARDVLYWNNDTTRLPAQLHAELLRLYQRNALASTGALRMLGADIELNRLSIPVYLVAGQRDQVVPWQVCHASERLFGGPVRFVLSEGGHIDTLICPPGSRNTAYWSDGSSGVSASVWRRAARRHGGSWWSDWLSWLRPLSDGLRPAPEGYGSARHPAGDAAPGRYIFQR